MAQIGVDEWVAQSGERRERHGGLAGRLDARERRASAGGRGWRWSPSPGWCSARSPATSTSSGRFNSLIYAILALGLNIAVGWAGLLDLGYIAFFGFGAYGYAIFSSTALGTDGAGGPICRRSSRSRSCSSPRGARRRGDRPGRAAAEGDYLAIVTLFVGQAFMEVVNNVDPGTLGGVNGLYGLDPFHGFGGNVTTPTRLLLPGADRGRILAGVLHLLDTSRTGRAWRALQDDPLAAEAMTIPVNKLKVMAFSFSAMVGALGRHRVRRPAGQRVSRPTSPPTS